MEQVNLFKKELFDKLKLASVFEELTPLSVQGNALKNRALQSLKHSNTFSLGFVDALIKECARVAGFDVAVKELHESLVSVVNESLFKYNIALLSEVIDNGLSKDSIQEMLVKECNALITESESTVRASLQNGALAVYENSNKAVRAINAAAKSLIKTNSDNVQVGATRIYSPVSYAEINEGTIFFRAKNHVFAMDKNGIRQAAAPSKSFVELSMLVESTDFVSEENCFKVRSKSFGEVEISEGKIFKKNADTQVFEEVGIEMFAKQVNMIIESRANNAFERSASIAMSREADGVIAIASNFKKIIKLDAIKIIENNHINEAHVFCSFNGRHSAGVLASNRKPKQFLSFGKLKDAIQYIKEETGQDLSDEFKDQLKVEDGQAYDKAQEIKEQNDVIAKLHERLSTVNEEISLVEHKSEAHSLLLQTQSTIKGMIIAENNKLNEIIKGL